MAEQHGYGSWVTPVIAAIVFLAFLAFAIPISLGILGLMH
jgi:hypothetical protein